MRLVVMLAISVLIAFGNTPRSALAQSQDMQAIKAANDSYYAALSSRDNAALDKLWDHNGQVFNIFGVSKEPMVGWDAVKIGYEDLFKRFPELSRQNG